MRKWHTKHQKIQKTMDFFEQILVLLELNLPLHRCLQRIPLISLQHEQLLIDLEFGQDLSFALDRLSSVLDPWGLSLLKIACQLPHPKECLKLYLHQQAIQGKIQDKIKQATFYPLLLMMLTIIIVILFKTQIFPSYQSLFKQLGLSSLPSTNPNLFLYLSLIPLGLKSGYFLKNFKQLMHWFEWLNLMSMAMASGLNFPNALQLVLAQLQNSHLFSWHRHVIQNVHLGQFQLVFPPTLPKVCQNILSLHQHSPDWQCLFLQASKAIELELLKRIGLIERYLQPILLFMITGFCAYFCILLYRPLLELGEQIF